MVVSASKDRADDFSTFCHKLITEVPILKHLKPTSEQRFRKDKWDVRGATASHAPSVKAVGIFGQLTGSRATLIIGDDCEVPNNAMTEDAREKLINRMLEFESILVPDGEIVLLGTPQTFESVYPKFHTRGYDCRIFPARYPDLGNLEHYYGCLAPSIMDALEEDPNVAGMPTDPDRFDFTDLARREATYGRSGFSLQFMLDTSLSDSERFPLRCRDLIISPLEIDKGPVSVSWGSSRDQALKDIPNVGLSGDRFYSPFRVDDRYEPYEGSVMSIDPSGRGKDEIAYAIVKQLHGRLFVHDCWGFRNGYEDDNLKALARKARDFKVNQIIIEGNFGDGMFSKLFQPVLNKIHPKCSIEEVKHHTQKELRIADTLEPLFTAHRLVVDQQLVEKDIKFCVSEPTQTQQYSLFYQMTHLTRDRGALRHDDRLDALAIAVNFWIDSMSRDEDLALEQWEETQLQDSLKEFMEHAGSKPFLEIGKGSPYLIDTSPPSGDLSSFNWLS